MAKRGRKRKKSVSNNINVIVTIMIVASIVLAVLIYTNSGFIGETLSPFLGGIMGYVKYILPVGVFAMAIYIAYQGESNWSGKIIQFSILLLAISIIMNVYQIGKGQITIEDNEFQDVLAQSYRLGVRNIGGGAVGMVFALPLINLIGKLATVIVSIGIIIVLLVIMFGIDLISTVSEIVENKKEQKEKN